MKLTRKIKRKIDSLSALDPSVIAGRLNLETEQVREYLETATAKGAKSAHNTAFNDIRDDSKQLAAPVKLFWERNKLAILLVLLAAAIPYLSGLSNGFVSDDLPLTKSPYLTNPFLQFINEPVSAVINSTTYTLNYLIRGTEPFGYHLGNLVLHLLVSLTAFYFLSLLTKKPVAFLAALIFAVSPLHSEAVFWVSGRHYILYSLFLLLSLIAYIRFSETRNHKSGYVYSLLLFIGAVYSFPEQAIVLPLFLPLIDFFRGGLKKTAGNFKYYVPFFALAFVFAYLSLGRVETRIAQVSGDAVSSQSLASNFLVTDAIAISSYLKLFFFPVGLSFYHEDVFTPTPIVFVMFVVITCLFFLIPAYLYKAKKDPILILASGIFMISLLPTLTPLKVSWVVAERYTYLGTLGLALFTAYILNLVLNSSRKIRGSLTFVLILTILAYGWITFYRGFDWRNEDSLWLATVQASPLSSKAWNNMGDYYGRHGDMQKSFEAFVRATQLNPSYADAWHNAGNTLLQMGKYDEAIPYFEKSLEFNPNLIEAYNNLARVYHKKGDQAKAYSLIRKSLSINPQAVKTYAVWASISYENKDFAQAREALTEGLKIDPQNGQLEGNLKFLENQTPN